MRRWSMVAIIVAMSIAYFLLGVNYINTTHKLHKQDRKVLALARAAKHQATTAQELSLAIQAQRRQAIFEACYDQNQRHLSLMRFLRQVSSNGVSHVARKFVNKLAPLQNCYRVVREATVGGRNG